MSQVRISLQFGDLDTICFKREKVSVIQISAARSASVTGFVFTSQGVEDVLFGSKIRWKVWFDFKTLLSSSRSLLISSRNMIEGPDCEAYSTRGWVGVSTPRQLSEFNIVL